MNATKRSLVSTKSGNANELIVVPGTNLTQNYMPRFQDIVQINNHISGSDPHQQGITHYVCTADICLGQKSVHR